MPTLNHKNTAMGIPLIGPDPKMMVYVAHAEGKKKTIIFKKTVPLKTGLSGQSGDATVPVWINQEPEKDIYLGEYETGVFKIGGSIEYTDIFSIFRSIKFTFSTTDSFWKDYPNDAHECTVLDQGFEAA